MVLKMSHESTLNRLFEHDQDEHLLSSDDDEADFYRDDLKCVHDFEMANHPTIRISGSRDITNRFI